PAPTECCQRAPQCPAAGALTVNPGATPPLRGLAAIKNPAASFDHLVRASQYRLRNGEAQCFSSLEIDYKLVLRGRLHRQVGRLIALEDAVDIARRAPALVEQIRPIRN